MRLTLDLDHVTENYTRKKAALCAVIFPHSKIKYRISSSGKGSHIVVHNCGLAWEECCQYRFVLGDHVRRIHIDQTKKAWGCPQVLFTKKGGKLSGNWKTFIPKSIYSHKTCIVLSQKRQGGLKQNPIRPMMARQVRKDTYL